MLDRTYEDSTVEEINTCTCLVRSLPDHCQGVVTAVCNIGLVKGNTLNVRAIRVVHATIKLSGSRVCPLVGCVVDWSSHQRLIEPD